MRFRKVSALAAAAAVLIASTTPALGQTAALPAPVSEEITDGSQLAGTNNYLGLVVGAAIVAAIIYVILEAGEDDDDDDDVAPPPVPVSP
jgi:hypothetical protein